jgi:hypothetical protein
MKPVTITYDQIREAMGKLPAVDDLPEPDHVFRRVQIVTATTTVYALALVGALRGKGFAFFGVSPGSETGDWAIVHRSGLIGGDKIEHEWLLAELDVIRRTVGRGVTTNAIQAIIPQVRDPLAAGPCWVKGGAA